MTWNPLRELCESNNSSFQVKLTANGWQKEFTLFAMWILLDRDNSNSQDLEVVWASCRFDQIRSCKSLSWKWRQDVAKVCRFSLSHALKLCIERKISKSYWRTNKMIYRFILEDVSIISDVNIRWSRSCLHNMVSTC